MPARAHVKPVNGRNTGNKLPLLQVAEPLAVIVSTREVPHQIAQIHIPQLIAAENHKIVAKRRLVVLASVDLHHFSVPPAPIGIVILGKGMRLPHTREEHIHLLGIDRFAVAEGNNRRVETTAVKQRRLLVLVAAYVGFQCLKRARIALIDRRIRRRTYRQYSVGRKAQNEKQRTQKQSLIPFAHGHLTALEDINQNHHGHCEQTQLMHAHRESQQQRHQ